MSAPIYPDSHASVVFPARLLLLLLPRPCQEMQITVRKPPQPRARQGEGPTCCPMLPAPSWMQHPWGVSFVPLVGLWCHGETAGSAQPDLGCGHCHSRVSPHRYKFSCLIYTFLHADLFSQKPLGSSLVALKSGWWPSSSPTWSVQCWLPLKEFSLLSHAPCARLPSYHNSSCHPGHFAKSGICGLPCWSTFYGWENQGKKQVIWGHMTSASEGRFQTPSLTLSMPAEMEMSRLRGLWRVEREFNCLVTQPGSLDCSRESNVAQQNHCGRETAPLCSPQDAAVMLLSAWHPLASLREKFGSCLGNTDVRRQFHPLLSLIVKLLSKVCHKTYGAHSSTDIAVPYCWDLTDFSGNELSG